MIKFYWLLVGTLAVWRVTHLLRSENGPFDFVVRLRIRAGAGFWGRLLDCFYCLSIWIALPAALTLGSSWSERLFLWPALSAGASLMERIGHREPDLSQQVNYKEDPNNEHVLLRPTETTTLTSDKIDPPGA
jgi:hypothetical protein